MLGVGWTEMLVIGIVALVVIGPKDLPVVMHRIGRFAATIRRMGNEFTRELNKTTGLDEVRNLRNSITQPLRQTADEIRREFNTMTASGVEPSGAIKPADPSSESVVDEIKAAAGMQPQAVTAVETPKVTPAPFSVPLRATDSIDRFDDGVVLPAADPVSTPALTEPVEPVKPTPRRRAKAAASPVPSPAPIEALIPEIATDAAVPPVRKPRARKTPIVTPKGDEA